MARKIIFSSVTVLFVVASSFFYGTIFQREIQIIDISPGWAGNSINTVIFRKNSVVSDRQDQYAAFYDQEGNVILAKRKTGSDKWEICKTRYKGTVKDAHGSISIMVDGDGYLHMAWNHHGNPLHYCKSKLPGGLELTGEMPMTGINEKNVTYPEFYRLPGGNLIFLYRDGSSGNGNLVINCYNTETKMWSTLQENLIDGEGERNAYWQMVVGKDGTLHLSWVWRETWDVATNHDICYAKSTDSGKSWIKSDGEKYELPITAASAEYVATIPQKSELINQTSMCTDSEGNPYVASYWASRGSNIPQYQLVYFNGDVWQTKQITERKTAFSLSGGGTKEIPISRPQILVDSENVVYLIFRDSERGSLVSAAICKDIEKNTWAIKDLTSFSVGKWEPTYDTELWKTSNKLNLFVQNVMQGDSEQTKNIPPQMVSVLEWEP